MIFAVHEAMSTTNLLYIGLETVLGDNVEKEYDGVLDEQMDALESTYVQSFPCCPASPASPKNQG